MRENQRLIEKAAIERGPEVDRKRCWWKRTGWWMSYHLRQVWTEWSSCWAIPSFLQIRSCFFFFVKTRTIPFLCFCLLFINTVLTVSCSPDFFCLLFSVVLWLLLVQLVTSTSTACVFCQRDIQYVFCHYAIPSYLSSLYLWKLRSSLNIFDIDNRLESSQMWIYLQKLVAWADLPGKVGRD